MVIGGRDDVKNWPQRREITLATASVGLAWLDQAAWQRFCLGLLKEEGGSILLAMHKRWRCVVLARRRESACRLLQL